MKLTADEARELARYFRDVSVALGNYRFKNWNNLSKEERRTIEDREWTLLNYSSDFITQAVGLTLDDAEGSLAKIEQATTKAKNAIKTIKTVQKVIRIAGTVTGLGAAIGTWNPGVIVTAIGDITRELEDEG